MIDITLFHIGGFHWWDDGPGHVETVKQEGFVVGYIRNMSLHSGTHIDLPMHVGFPNEGINIQDIYRVYVVDLDSISGDMPDNIEGVLIKTGQGLLIREGKIGKDYKALSIMETRYLLNSDIKLVGIDAPSIEPYRGDGYIHKSFLTRSVVVLENIFLEGVELGFYELYLSVLHIPFNVDALPAVAKLKIV